MNKRILWAGTLVFGVLLGSQFISSSISAQAPDTAKPETKTAERRGPLPDNYGKLGLTDSQKEKLYTTQEEYEQKLAALREQLKALVKERDQKMEAELTEGQKLRLKELREEALKKAKENPKGTFKLE